MCKNSVRPLYYTIDYKFQISNFSETSESAKNKLDKFSIKLFFIFYLFVRMSDPAECLWLRHNNNNIFALQ